MGHFFEGGVCGDGYNHGSIWLVRLSFAAILAPIMDLKGVWTAMCVELCFRGIIFLIRLYRGQWLNRSFDKVKD